MNITEDNKDFIELENSDEFRQGVLFVLCFVTPIVVISLFVALYYIY